MKKTIAALAIGGLSLGMVSLAALPASAHTPTFVSSCGQIALQLTNYPAGSSTTATVDGAPAWSQTFGPEGFQDSVNFDPKVKHTWTVTIVSGDGDPRYSSTITGESDAACYFVPPVVTPPVEPPVEPPVVTPPVTVVETRVQDYLGKCDATGRLAEFVFDNGGSNVAVDFTITDGTPAQVVTVPAGEVARPTPYSIPAGGATYTITTPDNSWTFTAAADCPVVVPPTTEPPVVEPPVVEPPVVEPPVVEPPVVEPPMAEVPVTEVPVDETPVTITPVVEAKPTPVFVKAAETKAPVAEGLAYTGSNPLALASGIGFALIVIVGGAAIIMVTKIRRANRVIDESAEI